MNLIVIDFKSRQCKVNKHDKCPKRWKGLSFENLSFTSSSNVVVIGLPHFLLTPFYHESCFL